MSFPMNPQIFDLLVLSVVSKADSYGYQISQVIKQVSDTQDSSLYPVLKRLQKQSFLKTYDQQFQGRNRKYYQITESGHTYLSSLHQEWNTYKTQIDRIVNGGFEL